MAKKKPINAQIYSEASDWLVEFRAGDVDALGRKEFYEWLRTSQEHMRAYLELAAIWNEAAGLDSDRVFDDVTLLGEAQAETKVVPLTASSSACVEVPALSPAAAGSGGTPSGAPVHVPTRAWSRRGMLSAAGVLLAVATGGWVYLSASTYTTRVGEQRSLVLEDGSRIELNARTRLRVRYNSKERGIELLAGQAFFSVVRDPTRPFVVSSEHTRIRAVGTQFDVYRRDGGTTVSVIEGRVAVTDRSSKSPATPVSASVHADRADDSERVLLDAGEQVVVRAHTAVKQTQPNVSAATAWTQGHIVFQGASLREVAEEFNRYNPRRLVVRGALADFNVTGVFSSTDPASLIRFLEARPGIAVTYAGDEIVVSRRP